MFQSDKAVGMFYTEALRFIERNDLWAEVVSIKTDAEGKVVSILHWIRFRAYWIAWEQKNPEKNKKK